jgi:hypothetical protein
MDWLASTLEVATGSPVCKRSKNDAFAENGDFGARGAHGTPRNGVRRAAARNPP